MIIIDTIIGIFVTFVLGILIKSNDKDSNFITTLKKFSFAIILVIIFGIVIVNFYLILVDTDMFWNNMSINVISSDIQILGFTFFIGFAMLFSNLFIVFNYRFGKGVNNLTNLLILALLITEWIIIATCLFKVDDYIPDFIQQGKEINAIAIINRFFTEYINFASLQIILFIALAVMLFIIAIDSGIIKFLNKRLDKKENDLEYEKNKKIYQEIEDHELFNDFKDLTKSKNLKEFKESHYYKHIKKYKQNKK